MILRFLAGIFCCLLVSSVFAEDLDMDTVFRHDDVWKAYTQLELKHTEIVADDAELAGLAIGWTHDKKWSLGVAGYTMFTDLEPNGFPEGIIDDLDMWYVGIRGEYTWDQDALIHFTFHFLAGGGEVESRVKVPTGDLVDQESRIFIFEPGVDVGINVYDVFELGFGLGYQVVADLDLDNLDDNDFNEFNVKFFLRFKQP